MAQIRRAVFTDEAALLELIAPHQSPAFHWPKDQFMSEFQSAETWILTDKISGSERIEAFICVRDAVQAWELSVLATRKESQGRGFMKALLQAVISEYGNQRQLWLEVHEHNLAARKLYEKCGFEPQGKRSAYYRDGASALLYTRPAS
jgi:ribosomal-protein-alanine N-acetyltransferase